MKEFKAVLSATAVTTVNESNFARTVKSGNLNVFSTPMMIALMEEATCKACQSLIDEGETTVGTKISITHDKADGAGKVITAEAKLTDVDGRRLFFNVCAKDDSGDCIGKGEIERFVVNTDKFMKRVNGQ